MRGEIMADYASSIRLEFTGAKEEEKEANEIIGRMLSEVDEYENEYTEAFADDAAISNYDLKEIVTSSAEMLVEKFPASRFEIEAAFSQLNAEGEARYTRRYDGNELHGRNIYCPYDFNGCCPECGCEVVEIDDFDPNTTYVCQECGGEFTLVDQEIIFSEF